MTWDKLQYQIQAPVGHLLTPSLEVLLPWPSDAVIILWGYAGIHKVKPVQDCGNHPTSPSALRLPSVRPEILHPLQTMSVSMDTLVMGIKLLSSLSVKRSLTSGTASGFSVFTSTSFWLARLQFFSSNLLFRYVEISLWQFPRLDHVVWPCYHHLVYRIPVKPPGHGQMLSDS